ncbi:MAG: hypothetical protein ACI37R_07045 [Candidatus Avigastranaerophilus sp.]
MIYKKRNIIIIILGIFIFGSIGFFNYLVDPYGIIHSFPNLLCISDYPRNMYPTVLKLSKKHKYEYLIIGSSATKRFINRSLFNNKNTIYMMTDRFNLSTQIKYLKFILSLHPEIKNIIFPIEYAFYYSPEEKRPLEKPGNKFITTNDIIKLFFSLDTTLNSIKTIVSDSKNISNKNNEQIQCDARYEEHVIFNKKNFIGAYKKVTFPHPNDSELEELKNLIEEKNKKITIIFPPYHALIQTIMEEKLPGKAQNLKQWVVNNFPDSKIIDFAYINNYTAEPIENSINYTDIAHPNGHTNYIFYCALKYPDKFQNKNIFVELSKDNIDEIINIQNEKLKQYSNNNREYIKKFKNYKHKDGIDFVTKNAFVPATCNYYLGNN